MAKIETIRHSLAHVLAMAVREIYPKAKLGMGPATETGFYYDFDFEDSFSEEDLPKIEKRMKKIVKRNLSFKKEKVSRKEAKEIFKEEPYKIELLEKMKEITIYRTNGFVDLCSGPHMRSTEEIDPKSFKLTRIAGAYWKGDEKNTQLTRIYGLAFESKEKLQKHLKIMEEAEKRDHRKLGRKLGIFLLDEQVGQGLPIWLPKGSVLRNEMESYLKKELTSQGYDWLYTPHIGKLDLWKESGHWYFYKENLYSPIKIESEEYIIKPMNCPFHAKVYNSEIRSYRDLPLKLAEMGTVYRYERSGTLHGLTRVRGFTQDDAHVICRLDQIEEEVSKLVKHGLKMLKAFGFKEYNIYLSTRPEKYAGKTKNWKKATDTLKKVLEEQKLNYQIDPGGGVFYGPKIDIKIKDSLNREWQCTTIQFDFNLPERFKMKYIDEKGKKKEPFMIHRALLGSMERFTGVLLEHYAGALPLWLSPVQVQVIPVGSDHRKYAEKIKDELREACIRAEAKTEKETVSKKIREGEVQKIPYLLVVGDEEKKKSKVRARKRGKGDIGLLSLKKFIQRTKKEIENKNA